MPDAVGWAVIDYIKNGRPKYFESDIVFLKHMPPFDPISDHDHLEQRIVFHMNKAGIRKDKNKHRGFHSLRHSAGSMLLDMGTPLPVITTILGIPIWMLPAFISKRIWKNWQNAYLLRRLMPMKEAEFNSVFRMNS